MSSNPPTSNRLLAAADSLWSIIKGSGWSLVTTTYSNRQEAVQSIYDVTQNATDYDLLDLSRRRGQTSYYSFHEIPLRAVEAFLNTTKLKNLDGFLAILTFHRNGYLRGLALKSLIANNSPIAFPYILLRTTDWVAPISEQALKYLSEKWPSIELSVLQKHLALILWLHRHRQDRHPDLIQTTLSRIEFYSSDAALDDALSGLSKQDFRELFRICCHDSRFRAKRWISRGLSSTDPVLNILSCRYASDYYQGLALEEKLTPFLSSRSFSLRREAIRYLAVNFPDKSRHYWIMAALDSSRGTRDMGRYYLNQLNFPVTDYLRQHLVNNPDDHYAFQSLAESANAADLEYFLAHVNHPRTKFRLAAVRGIITINPPGIVDILLAILNDANRNIRAEVLTALSETKKEIPRHRIMQIALDTANPHIKKDAIRLLVNTGKWSSFSWLLQLANSSDNVASEFATRAIEYQLTPEWISYVFNSPSPKDRELLEHQLALRDSPLARKIRHELSRITR